MATSVFCPNIFNCIVADWTAMLKPMIKRLLLLPTCASILLLAACASTSVPDTEFGHYLNMSPSSLSQQASSGDPMAQYTLSNLYKKGFNGYIPNKDLSQYWAEQARQGFTAQAEQGDALAMFMIGNIYMANQSVYKDTERIWYWYTQAAEAGYTEAQMLLASFYANGILGNETDWGKASYWCKRALPEVQRQAEQGSPYYQIALAGVYQTSEVECGISLNQAKSEALFSKGVSGLRQLAASGKRPDIMMNLMLYYNNKDISAIYNPQKGYIVATMLATQITGTSEVSSLITMMQEISFDAMPPEEQELAKRMAQECVKNPKPACY